MNSIRIGKACRHKAKTQITLQIESWTINDFKSLARFCDIPYQNQVTI